ncbi:hypothetical protein L3Q82_000558 [Scortum barcoo]|uniref:Uncharacterized protein n=1 Tax=Scortum barcoo TaxID=214431 RepID=A0ACB8WG15_9TELE|nr:hypothetical protein L3Q82_000558 [Scortum barcoo]
MVEFDSMIQQYEEGTGASGKRKRDDSQELLQHLQRADERFLQHSEDMNDALLQKMEENTSALLGPMGRMGLGKTERGEQGRDIDLTSLRSTMPASGPLQLALLGPTLEPGLGLGLAGERLVAGSLPTGPGRAQPEMATWARLPVGSPPAGRSMRGRCNVVWVAVVAGGLDRPNPWTKTLAIGTWNVTSLGGKEPELVREVERYRLEIVGLTSTHSLGSGTQLLERGWTLHYSGVAQGERRRAGVGLLIAPQLSRHVLEFTPVNERVASLRLRVGDRSLAVVCAYGPNSSTEYPGLLGVPGRGT